MRGNVGACIGLYGKGFSTEHSFAQFVAEAINHAVVGTHPLLHDFRGNPDHVGVANLAAFDDLDDGHPGAKFAGLGGHAHDSDVGGFQGGQDFRGSFAHGAGTKGFQ